MVEVDVTCGEIYPYYVRGTFNDFLSTHGGKFILAALYLFCSVNFTTFSFSLTADGQRSDTPFFM